MRNEKVIKLGNKRVATVRELRLKDVRRLVGEMNNFSSLQVTDLLGEQFDRILELAGDLVVMPEGETAEDLTLSEVELVIEAMQEVNASFLQRIGVSLALAQAETLAVSEPLETLTEPLAE